MYICLDCGKVFENEEVEYSNENEGLNVDSFLGRPIRCESFIEVEDCTCGGIVEKAIPCENCGAWIPELNTLCDECLEKYKTLDTALDIGGEWDGNISLNGFLLSFYSRDDIEQILLDSIRNEREEKVRNAVERYCNEDKECFKECAERKWREEKSYI